MNAFANLAETGAADMVQDPQMQALLPKASNINFALDEEVKTFIDSYLWQALITTVGNRSSLESEWMAIQRLSELVHDGGQKYIGRSNAYLPTYAQSKNTQVTMLSKGLFPSDEFLDVWDRDLGQTEAGAAVKAYMQFQLENRANLRYWMKQMLAQFVDFGNGCLKYTWRKELKSLGKVKRKGNEISQIGYEPTSIEGLTVSVPSMFNVYAYPETAAGLRDLLWIAERVKVPKIYLEEMKRKERWENVDLALQSTGTGFLNGRATEQETLQDKNSLGTAFNYTTENPMSRMYEVWEVWCSMPLPKDAYVNGEVVGTPLSTRIVFVNGTICFVGRNPYFHQQPPYLFARQKVQPGCFYGSGSGRNGRSYQYLINDFTNQTNDAGCFALNPVMVVNSNYMSRPPGPFRPGVQIHAKDIDKAFKFEKMPLEIVQSGQQLISMYIGLQQDGTGAPPGLQGTGTGKGSKTATGMQILQSNASSPLQDLVEDLEVQVMVPLMENGWSLAIQYENAEYMARTAGGPILMVPREMDITPEFKFLASNQAVNKQQRAAQAMQFIQVASQMQPFLQAQGKMFDPTPLLQKIFTDALGFRGFEAVIKQIPMPGMPPPGQPGIPGQIGQDPRSATEQIPGGNGMDMQPGEGQDFMNVRQGADEMAAQQGALSGGTFPGSGT